MADRKRRDSVSNAARILCVVLVALMILGSVSALVISLLSVHSSAYSEPVISVGIQYGDGATSSFRTYSETGYIILKQQSDGNRSSVRIGTIDDKSVSVTVSSRSQGSLDIVGSSGQVLYKFDPAGDGYLGLMPAGSGDVYMRSDNGYIYEGSFMYMRSGYAVTVVNMIGLETYLEGVLPYEISSTWPIEAQKAFAIAARSYAAGNIGKHYSEYGFDLCCTTNCQVYRGAGGVNDTVKAAVAQTAGKVLRWNGKIVALYYSSSTGGCTVSAEDCWGGTGSGYLAAVNTPWERYTEYNNAFWTAEVSPVELCEHLRGRGYTDLTGAVSSVTIDEYAKNSSYVKSLKITDTSGNSVVISGTDRIRIALSGYVNSANFLVGRGSVSYTISHVSPSGEIMPYSSQNMSSFSMITAIGQVISGLADRPSALTGYGRYNIDGQSGYVITADNVKNGGDLVPNGYKATYENKSGFASSSDNFLFVGKGWGHGVGLSQYGCKDLAEFGYSYDRILAAYVPAAQIGTME